MMIRVKVDDANISSEQVDDCINQGMMHLYEFIHAKEQGQWTTGLLDPHEDYANMGLALARFLCRSPNLSQFCISPHRTEVYHLYERLLDLNEQLPSILTFKSMWKTIDSTMKQCLSSTDMASASQASTFCPATIIEAAAGQVKMYLYDDPRNPDSPKDNEDLDFVEFFEANHYYNAGSRVAEAFTKNNAFDMLIEQSGGNQVIMKLLWLSICAQLHLAIVADLLICFCKNSSMEDKSKVINQWVTYTSQIHQRYAASIAKWQTPFLNVSVRTSLNEFHRLKTADDKCEMLESLQALIPLHDIIMLVHPSQTAEVSYNAQETPFTVLQDEFLGGIHMFMFIVPASHETKPKPDSVEFQRIAKKFKTTSKIGAHLAELYPKSPILVIKNLENVFYAGAPERYVAVTCTPSILSSRILIFMLPS